jgi:putative transposase
VSVFRFIAAEKASHSIVIMCRVLEVSRSGYHAWSRRPLGPRAVEDARLTERIRELHKKRRQVYGSPRIWSDLVVDDGERIGRKRVERLMRQAGVQGLHRRKGHGCTRRDPAAVPADDLVNRGFDPDGPDRLWCMDVTEHPTGTGKVYLAVVLDAFSRMVIGWSIADHIRSELVVDALQMAVWRRRPPPGRTVAHSDHGSQYTSWAFGRRLRAAGLLGSMGTIGDCFDNSMVESFFGTLQLELLDQRRWDTRDELALAIFEWIEAWYNPRRRHSYCGMLSPADYETAHTPAATAA